MTTPKLPNAVAADRTDFINGARVALSDELARHVADELNRNGYAKYTDPSGRVFIFRTSATPESIKASQFAEIARFAILEHLETGAALGVEFGDERAVRVAKATLSAITRHRYGVTKYVADTVNAARSRLRVLDDAEHAALLAATAAATRAPAPLTSAEYSAARRAKEAEAAHAQALEVLPKWLAPRARGRHELLLIWMDWQDALAKSKAFKDKYPALASVGKTIFYKYLAEVAPVYTGAGRRRYVILR